MMPSEYTCSHLNFSKAGKNLDMQMLLSIQFAHSNEPFREVLSGQVSVHDFFTKEELNKSKNAYMDVYRKMFGTRPKDSLYLDENIAAAWIAKLRFNEHMTGRQFIKFVDRSEKIFKGENRDLKLKNGNAENNDLCAIMWGIEALNGIQGYDSGATRVRFPAKVAPKIVRALERAGSVPRYSTHATCTKLVDKGLGKDLEDEGLRAFTPRGKGALLVIPTSKDGNGSIAKASKTISFSIHKSGTTDYDLLLKCEDYGYNDTQIHSYAHSKLGFINYLTQHRAKYKEGMALIRCKSELAKQAEREFGEGSQIRSKEHLSELKEQSAPLVTLLEAGKKMGLFNDFKTTWVIRIQWPPWERKIVSTDLNRRKGLGDFLYQLVQAEESASLFAINNKNNLDKVRELLIQAKGKRFSAFKKCREGNEVLVNCQYGTSILVDNVSTSIRNNHANRGVNEFKKITPSPIPGLNFVKRDKLRNLFEQPRRMQQQSKDTLQQKAEQEQNEDDLRCLK